jgi:hypothetical protein
MAGPDEKRRRHDGLITFAASFASLFAAGGATRLVSTEPLSLVSTILFFVLILAYAVLTGPGRRAELRHYVLSGIGVPALFVVLLLPLALLSDAAARLFMVGGRVGLPMWWGGPDGFLPVVGVIWGVSVAVPLFGAVLARSFVLPAVEEFIHRRWR